MPNGDNVIITVTWINSETNKPYHISCQHIIYIKHNIYTANTKNISDLFYNIRTNCPDVYSFERAQDDQDASLVASPAINDTWVSSVKFVDQ